MSEYAANSKILVSSDGTRIYADASGNPEKPGIVFIHGQGLSGAVFDVIFSDKRFTEEFYLVRYDMRGHGRSGKPDTSEAYESKPYADDFAAVMKAFNLRKPVVVGWSLGSTVCADIAAHLPDTTLAGIVYLAGVPYVGDIVPKICSPEIIGMRPKLFDETSVTTFVTTIKENIDSLFLDTTKIPWDLKCFWIGMAASQRPTHRKLSLSRSQDPTRLFELAAQGLPLLILGGKYDRQVNQENLIEELRPRFKDMEMCIIEKGGSHAVFYENPGEVMERIIVFARRVKAEVGHFYSFSQKSD
ncbi:alpha/beta-hydrolase [Sanghuangporus baumii]|uniref:Alpha/beta-hydrolase n=1 Tax=Sanghuangporus baumii TaxID=108892 RepID=A0A9Q5I145_SANBA|nr:alpha/beta-hydrolase [Sanghuangporus baumii]